MDGEVRASKRPVNSLLDADLDFDQGGKMAPVLTEEVLASIEEIIKARVTEGLWDDVTRVAALQPQRYRPKSAEIPTEKSKVGLGEQYAAEYEETVLGAASTVDAATTKAHAAVRELLGTLTGKLDALFNFHATPRPPKLEATVRAAVSAVSMEEAMPSAITDVELLAPEEVYGKRSTREQLSSRGELSQDERKALRRRKKRVHARKGAESTERMEAIAKSQPGGAVAQRLEKGKVDAALADAKRKGTITSGGAGASPTSGKGGGHLTKSAQFFQKMQAGEAGQGSGAGGKRKAAFGADDSGPHKPKQFKL